MTAITIGTQEIDENKFKLLANELVENSVGSDSSPFHNIKTMLSDELDGTDLDTAQKAGIFAGFLKDAYSDINKQAMNTALDLMKANVASELQRYEVQAKYNDALMKLDIDAEKKLLANKENQLKDKEIAVANKKIDGQHWANMKLRAELKKMYGVKESMTMQIGNGVDTYGIVNDGNMVRYYRCDANGDMLMKESLVITHNDDDTANNGGNDQWTFGVKTTTNIAEMIPGVLNTVTVSDTLTNTQEKGSVDKQIEGFDKVNQKDLVKTLNELAGMFANSQTCIPDWISKATKELIRKVDPTMATDLTSTNCPQ